MVGTPSEVLEQRALKVIEEAGEEGILQSELFKLLGVDSRVGSRIVIRLTKKGIIRKDKVTVNGKTTYKLFIAKSRTPALRIKVDVSSILDIPCLTCRYRGECGPGGFHQPATCTFLNEWLRSMASLGGDGRRLTLASQR